MALLRVDFFSETLRHTVTANVVLPTDKIVEGEAPSQNKTYKTLYLLHGMFGNYTDWVTGTRIQSWAQEKDLAVVMPSGENKFYVDNPKTGEMYGKFIGEELVEFTRRSFPLSRKREDTFIGGLSMGGYGALRNGLFYSDTFGAIVALSSGLIKERVLHSQYQEEWSSSNRYYLESIFGDIDRFEGSEFDYEALVKKLVAEGKEVPKIYLACGTEDFLYRPNLEYHRFLEQLGVEHCYVEGPGVHDWVFWDTYIKKALDWLPLGPAVQGLSSGHVGEKAE